MPDADLIGCLGVWEGYQVDKVERFEAGARGTRAQICIYLVRSAEARNRDIGFRDSARRVRPAAPELRRRQRSASAAPGVVPRREEKIEFSFRAPVLPW